MAQTVTISIPAKSWTLITTAAVAAARVQNVGPYGVWVTATTAAVAPSDANVGMIGEIYLQSMHGFSGDLTLSELFPGTIVASPYTGYLWVWSNQAARISVSHA